MAGQKQDDQLEHTSSSYVRIRDVALEDLPEAMNDREKWRERVRDIRACGTNDDDDDEINDWYLIKLLVIHINTWNTLCSKWMSNVE